MRRRDELSNQNENWKKGEERKTNHVQIVT